MSVDRSEADRQCSKLLENLDVGRCENSSFFKRLHFQLASLPHCLQDKEWFSAFVSWKCNVCGTVPSHPAICLLCSARVCKNGNCCRSATGVGECSLHADVRHADVVLFFDVQDNSVLIIRGGAGGCITKSPYLDSFGEEDVGLRVSVSNLVYLC